MACSIYEPVLSALERQDVKSLQGIYEEHLKLIDLKRRLSKVDFGGIFNDDGWRNLSAEKQVPRAILETKNCKAIR